MINKLYYFFLSLLPVFVLSSQHLPLQTGNQWQYEMDVVPGSEDYGAVAFDTIIINDKSYFEIHRLNYLTGELISITYDRLEGDSAYYRLKNGTDSLIINFNWQEGFTQISQFNDSCFALSI